MDCKKLVCAVTSEASLSKKICAVCGNKTGLFSRSKLLDGYICNDCLQSINQDIGENPVEIFSHLHITQLPEYAFRIQEEKNTIESELKIFNTTRTQNKRILIDEPNKLVKIAKNGVAFFAYQNKDYKIFRFDQIAKYDLVENGNTVKSGGIGRAVAGALLFGGVGAIVGASTSGSKQTCSLLQIRIAIKNSVNSSLIMNFVTSEIKKSSLLYKLSFAEAQQCMSDLDVILSFVKDQPVSTERKDITSELRKYKALLDDNIITLEDFEAKKRQLLGL
ncbi:MAG: DUF4428 domain-containing protein [Pyramidobacter sp.]|nr:DUF4428 domain-containing protein [Pyramidobacter sp.]